MLNKEAIYEDLIVFIPLLSNRKLKKEKLNWCCQELIEERKEGPLLHSFPFGRVKQILDLDSDGGLHDPTKSYSKIVCMINFMGTTFSHNKK